MFNTKFLAVLCKVSAIAWTAIFLLWAGDTIYAEPYAGSFSGGLGFAIGAIGMALVAAAVFYIGFACAYKYLTK